MTTNAIGNSNFQLFVKKNYDFLIIAAKCPSKMLKHFELVHFISRTNL